MLGSVWWASPSGARIAALGRAKTWNTPVSRLGNSHFPVFQFCSHASSLPLSCMCMTTSITHVCRRSPSLAPPHGFSPCPFASHTGLTRSLSLPVLLLVTICVCLEIALRTCCSRLGESELMTDRISSQTRNSHAHRARKSRPASPEHRLQRLSLLSY